MPTHWCARSTSTVPPHSQVATARLSRPSRNGAAEPATNNRNARSATRPARFDCPLRTATPTVNYDRRGLAAPEPALHGRHPGGDHGGMPAASMSRLGSLRTSATKPANGALCNANGDDLADQQEERPTEVALRRMQRVAIRPGAEAVHCILERHPAEEETHSRNEVRRDQLHGAKDP